WAIYLLLLLTVLSAAPVAIEHGRRMAGMFQIIPDDIQSVIEQTMVDGLNADIMLLI
ncbi:hypothetical protein KIPB_017330, partial [Kipferlia bialata]